MSRDHNEPLLREMEPIRAPQSTLTKELSHEMNEARHKPHTPSQRVIVVHYWSTNGQHLMHQFTATQHKTVREVIALCLEHFSVSDDLGAYQLKFANKEGEAKLDLPCEV